MKVLLRIFFFLAAGLSVVVFVSQLNGVYTYWKAHGHHLETYKHDSPLSNLDTSVYALLACAVACFGYLVSKKADERSQNHRVLELFLKFDDEHYRKVRVGAWAARSKWYRLAGTEGEEWRRGLIGGLVPLNENYGIPTLREQDKAGPSYYHEDERWTVFQMLNLYEALRFFECDNDKLGRVGLYYPYWRGFLREVIKAYEEAWSKLSREEQRQLPREQWREAFDDLDKRFNLDPYDSANDPQLKFVHNQHSEHIKPVKFAKSHLVSALPPRDDGH